MIWIWISAALILSLLPLINKKIDLSYYIWLILPLDAYGIRIAGTVFKPCMLFAVIVTIVMYAKNKGSGFDLSATKGQLFAGIISILMLTQSIFIDDSLAAVKGSIMCILIYVCAQLYTSSTNCNNDEQLSDVFIATCFGYGAIFLLAYLLLQGGLELGGIVTTERTAEGMFFRMSTMNNGAYVEGLRLRGFAHDPNTMFPMFIFGTTACVSRLFKKFNLYYIITLVISILCIILSSSRMGLICCAFAIIVTSVVSIVQIDSVKKKLLSFTSILFGSVGLLIVLISDFGQSLLASLLSTYSNRSGLTDEYGRFSIWKDCFNVYWEKNPLFGVGLGNMDKYATTERMTHNTWLEFICECGLLVGGLAVIYFISVMFIGWAKTGVKHRNDPNNTSYLCLVIGYTITIISLISVDNVMCGYMWFGALLVLKMAAYRKPEVQIE